MRRGPAIGRRIRKARTEAGMSQEDLALEIGRGDQAQVSKWERARKVPSWASIRRLADVLGVCPHWIAKGVES